MTVETLLITGATGFVGSHVLEATRGQGIRIRALVRKPADAARLTSVGVECIAGSLEDMSAVRDAVAGADAVLHLAAATKARNLDEYQRANVGGTQAVVEAMLNSSPRPKRLIYLSSLAAAGPAQGGKRVTRDDSPRPLTAYGRTKLAGEKVCEAVGDLVEVGILRAPAVYGPRDRDVYDFFKMAKYGVVMLPSGPIRHLQMIHVADLARALVMAATGERVSGVYHVAESRSYEMDEMARLVIAAVGKPSRIVHLPPGFIETAAALSEKAAGLLGKSTIFNRDKAREILAPAWLCETELARRDFGFETHIALADGLKQTAQWYRDNKWL
ncbi:MAG TPA: NAD-dependent epimerase/dehydratase family protein [Longimicrobiales bacterium]|nr:NAD-dependent epimerase/dehydratase family protein [Longimicrobiales bacterium]